MNKLSYCRAVIVLSSLALLVACGLQPSCADQAGPFLAQMQGIAREWDDANKLAGQTPRASLSGQIASLQAIKRKAEDVEAPECAAAVKTALVSSMSSTIDGYIAFLGQQPNTAVKAAFDKAADQMKTFTDELAKLKIP